MSRNISGPAKGVLATIATVVVVSMISLLGGSAGATGHAPAAAGHTQGKALSKIVFRSAEGTFRGTFVPHRFAMSGDQMVAMGTVTGKVHLKGQKPQRVSQDVTAPVEAVNGAGAAAGMARMASAAAGPGECNVLNLVLGPLDLNLLGLEVHLNTVVLDIVANPAGGLLGQLLCAVAHLLDSGPLAGLLTQLVGLLNQILGQLGLLTA